MKSGDSTEALANNSQFRARYRARINPSYSPILHAGSVGMIGLMFITFACSKMEQLNLSELWIVPVALVIANIGEYVTHRYWGHVKRRIGGLFYLRHTVDHHSFFTHDTMPIEQWRDWRVVLFPTWLILVLMIAIILPGSLLLNHWFSINVSALFAVSILANYLFYEFMHTCFHLPDGHSMANLSYVRWMAAHHAKHHEHQTMKHGNFNLTWPLGDVLFRTLIRTR